MSPRSDIVLSPSVVIVPEGHVTRRPRCAQCERGKLLCYQLDAHPNELPGCVPCRGRKIRCSLKTLPDGPKRKAAANDVKPSAAADDATPSAVSPPRKRTKANPAPKATSPPRKRTKANPARKTTTLVTAEGGDSSVDESAAKDTGIEPPQCLEIPNGGLVLATSKSKLELLALVDQVLCNQQSSHRSARQSLDDVVRTFATHVQVLQTSHENMEYTAEISAAIRRSVEEEALEESKYPLLLFAVIVTDRGTAEGARIVREEREALAAERAQLDKEREAFEQKKREYEERQVKEKAEKKKKRQDAKVEIARHIAELERQVQKAEDSDEESVLTSPL
jgi:hypothetical protein